MREIKFRGFNGNPSVKGKFIYGDLIRFGDDLEYTAITPHQEMAYDEYPVKAETVGQYTGLKDKNGKEIYEGDITNNGIIRFGRIEEINGIGFYLESHFSRNVFGELFRFTTPFEVIGNIYENPELLEK